MAHHRPQHTCQSDTTDRDQVEVTSQATCVPMFSQVLFIGPGQVHSSVSDVSDKEEMLIETSTMPASCVPSGRKQTTEAKNAERLIKPPISDFKSRLTQGSLEASHGSVARVLAHPGLVLQVPKPLSQLQGKLKKNCNVLGKYPGGV